MHRFFRRSRPLLLVLIFGVAAFSLCRGEVKLGALFSDHMVIQRGMPVPVWGTANPGERITVSIADQTKTASADASGNWSVRLDPMQPGAPQTLTVKGDQTVTVNDVLVGEVWLASGQSNMDYQLRWNLDFNAPDIAASTDPELRIITMPHQGNLEPQKMIAHPPAWMLSNPKTAPSFSAVAYYYGHHLRTALNVPVGMIVSSYGGTRAEAWVPLPALESSPEFQAAADKDVAAMKVFPKESGAFRPALDKWIIQNNEQDSSNPSETKGWAQPDFDDSSWKTLQVRASLASTGMKSGGVVWWRKSIVLPEAKPFQINTDWTSGSLTVYFNGTPLQELNPPPEFSHGQRRYDVPASLIRAGQPNLVAIRQYALTAQDGFYQITSAMGFPVPDPKTLDNAWKFNVEQTFAPLSADALQALPKYPEATPQNTPSELFNDMIVPLLPYAIKGTIWYQGESNAPNSVQYADLLTLLIKSWRERWGEGDVPFNIEQLANYGAPPVQPKWSNVAEVREAQLKVSETQPNCGLAVAIDIGEETIHPRNKREVGHRLSLIALNRTYGQRQPDSGPIYTGMKVEGTRIRVSFKELNGGLVAKGGPLKQFAIAGVDKKFVWADAAIDGDTVLVSSPSITMPVAVRYAWAGNPQGCNLYSADGLPASPFRTDTWEPAPLH